jgi:hypothetical protein
MKQHFIFYLECQILYKIWIVGLNIPYKGFQTAKNHLSKVVYD